MKARLFLLLILLTTAIIRLDAQPVLDIIRQHPAYAACNYNTYPDSLYRLTPAPKGKHPFYISHYGRHGSRYINNPRGYDIPHAMMLQAENVDELTPTGKKVLAEMNLILKSSENRWGELAEYGRQQHRWIARHMTQQFPEVFQGNAWIEAKSTIVPRCIISMGTELSEFAQYNPQLRITQEASKRDMWYMNYQDPTMRRAKLSPEAQKAFDQYSASRLGNSRLMELIFKNPDIVKEMVHESEFNYYLMKMGLFQLNTHLYRNTFLINIFQPEELYRMWQIDNALWYAQYANFTPNNGGQYPYPQRHLLRRIISDADSCLHLEGHGTQLRFGHETVLLPLVCLVVLHHLPHGLQSAVRLLSQQPARQGHPIQGAAQRAGSPSAHSHRLRALLPLARLPPPLPEAARQLREAAPPPLGAASTVPEPLPTVRSSTITSQSIVTSLSVRKS